MEILEGPVSCRPVVNAKHAGVFVPLINTAFRKTRILGSGFWGLKGKSRDMIRVGSRSYSPFERKRVAVWCSFSSSSDVNGSKARNFYESDEDYVNSTVLESVEVKSGSDGFVIKMRDGRNLRCVHNNPQGGNLPDYAPNPAIVLKMEDGKMCSVLLMAAVRNVQIARPTVYQVVKDMIEKMGYSVQLVRVTKRVHGAYLAQLYLTKIGNEKETISFDLRPSDAINIAVRCQVPIQVNRHVAYSDGMRVAEPAKMAAWHPPSDGSLFQEPDRPSGQPCSEAKEFNLVWNMLIAVVEERYRDAAQWRDKLLQLQSKKKNWA